MTEDQTTSEDSAADSARQAEIDALAAQLASAAAGEADVKAAPRKRGSRRVTAKDPAEFATAEIPLGAPAADEQPAAEEAADGERPEAASDEADESASPADPSETEVDAESAEADTEGGEPVEGEPRSGRSRRGRSRNRSGGGEAAQGGQNGQNGGQPQPQQQGNRRGRGRGQLDDLEPEILEDDVLIPVAGILDVLDNYAFVRTTGYLAGPTDVYVSLGQVKKYGLRRGDAVVGAIRQPREGEQPGRQKYNALVKVDSVNGQSAEQSLARPEFAAATPVEPEAGTAFRGQRVLVPAVVDVVEESTRFTESTPDAHVMVLLVEPKPEQVTATRRAIKGEVIVAGLEQAAEDHVTVAELAIERAKRLVELGLDVVFVIDSITGLARAYHALAPRAGIDDPMVATPVKRLFASGRKLEDGASLTVIAAAAHQSASIDRLVLDELKQQASVVRD